MDIYIRTDYFVRAVNQTLMSFAQSPSTPLPYVLEDIVSRAVKVASEVSLADMASAAWGPVDRSPIEEVIYNLSIIDPELSRGEMTVNINRLVQAIMQQLQLNSLYSQYGQTLSSPYRFVGFASTIGGFDLHLRS